MYSLRVELQQLLADSDTSVGPESKDAGLAGLDSMSIEWNTFVPERKRRSKQYKVQSQGRIGTTFPTPTADPQHFQQQ